ncbi:hypothetical protein BS17DRAFT_497618 [Gyrodon lividus]|nr:hypothetical protein BS17DRAFT_497618 [Gyrodon lividus]
MGAEASRELQAKQDGPGNSVVSDTPQVEPRAELGEHEAKDTKKCDPMPTVLLLSDNKPTTHECKATASAPGYNCILDSHMDDVADSPHKSVPQTQEIRSEGNETEVSTTPTQCVEIDQKDIEAKERVTQRVSPRRAIRRSLPSLPQLTESGEIQFHLTGGDQMMQFDGFSKQLDLEPEGSLVMIVPARGKTNDKAEDHSVLSLSTNITGSSSEGCDSLLSIIIPESFECDDSTQKLEAADNPPSTDAVAQMHSSTMSIACHLEPLPLLPPRSGVCDLKHALECIEVASDLQEETSIPFAATYADAANLAAKYPHLASKILMSPLRASSGASLREKDEAFVFPKAEKDSTVQSPNMDDREHGCRRPPKVNQMRSEKPAIRTEKTQTASRQKGDENSLGLERKISSGSRTGSITQQERSPRPPGTTVDGGAASAHKGRQGSSDPDLTKGYRKPKCGGPYADGTAQVPQMDSRRSVGASMAIHASAKHARTQSGRAASRHHDAQGIYNGAAVAPDSKKVLRRRPPTESRTGYRGRADTKRIRDHADRQREVPTALRAYDCVLGSHVLQGDNLVITPPSVSEIEELRQFANRSYDIFQYAGPVRTFDTFPHPSEHHPESPTTQLALSTRLRPGTGHPPPFVNSSKVLNTLGARVPVSGEQEQMLELEPRLLRARGSFYGATAFGGTLPYSVSDRVNITTMENKQSSSHALNRRTASQTRAYSSLQTQRSSG